MKRTAEDKKVPTIRCAIYTRKSTEEGLEQEFNSLDAHRRRSRPADAARVAVDGRGPWAGSVGAHLGGPNADCQRQPRPSRQRPHRRRWAAIAPSAAKWLQATRQELQASGVLADDGGQLVFKEDHTFKTPSGAATAILGRNANGWREWKSKFGGTLDDVKRQVADGAADREG